VSVADYFTPFNQATLNKEDLDFAGSGAAVLLPSQPGPNPDLMVAAGKIGTLYLINRDNMGKYNASGDQVVQSIPSAVGNGQQGFTPPVYFQEKVYYSGSDDVIKGFQLENGLFEPTPFATSETSFGYLGAGLALTAAPGGENVILWALQGSSKLGVLYAYNALTLEELYDTTQAPNKADNFGEGVKFSIPTIANGKVYVGTQTNVTVFGLKTNK
jgi:outer membrane protein assembly factor BamB